MLFVLSYSLSIFSVKAASANGAMVVFRENKDAMTTRDGTKSNSHVHDRLLFAY